MDKGCTVIDTRHELEGSNLLYNVESIKGSFLMSENGNIATWAGSFIKPET